MSSTQHSEEAWAVVALPGIGYKNNVFASGGGHVVANFYKREDAASFAKTWTHGVKYRIQRVRISTIGAKGRKGVRRG